MAEPLAELLESPTLPEVAQIITERLAAERDRRERFYDEIRDDQKAEFINGQVIMDSPAKMRHILVRDYISDLLRAFVRLRGEGLVLGEKALCVFPRNDYEPDICYFGAKKAAGINRAMTKFPVPDFVVEVLSNSTEGRDRGVKFRDYEARGVKEYWIINPESEVLEQYLLNSSGKYELSLQSGSGEVRCHEISGLTLPIRAFFDEQANLSLLRQLLGKPC